MFDLKFQINGHDVAPNNISEELGRAIRREAVDSIRTTVTGVRCPVHGSVAANFRMTDHVADQMHFTYEACCTALEEAIETALT